jgi:hypothetical protein
MEQHCSCKVLQIANTLFSHSIRMVSVDSCKGDALSFVFASLQPLLCSEYAIVGMVCLDFHSLLFDECFKRNFPFYSFVSIG